MNLDMSVVFINLLELFLLIGVGALCGRARIFPEETPKVFSILLTRITLPCTLFVALAGKSYAPEFVGAMDMDWKDREKSQDQDS